MNAPPDDAPAATSAPQRSFWQLGPAVWVATGLGVGLVPFAPGTVGTLWGIPLAWALGHLPWWGSLASIAVLCGAGIPVCTAAARRLGRKDPGAVVLDEIASLPITFYLVLDYTWSPARMAAVLVAGFVLHRVFDITKPPPARRLEQLPEGLGIMADDWSAGVWSCLLLHAALWLGAFDWIG